MEQYRSAGLLGSVFIKRRLSDDQHSGIERIDRTPVGIGRIGRESALGEGTASRITHVDGPSAGTSRIRGEGGVDEGRGGL